MILGAEIGLLLYGIYSLITGKYSVGKGRVLVGGKARILGFLCVLPLPIAFGAGIILGFFFALVLNEPVSPLIATVVEILILVVIAVVVSLLGKRFYKEQEERSIQLGEVSQY